MRYVKAMSENLVKFLFEKMKDDNNKVEVVFEKANGDERKMSCTRDARVNDLDFENTTEELNVIIERGLFKIYEYNVGYRQFDLRRLNMFSYLENGVRVEVHIQGRSDVAEQEESTNTSTPTSTVSNGSDTVVRLRKTNGEIKKLLQLLAKKDSQVKIRFYKANGDLRDMTCTRDNTLDECAEFDNSKESLEAIMESGLVNIYEFGVGHRKFAIERLRSYMVENENGHTLYVFETNAMDNEGETVVNESINYFNVGQLNGHYVLDALANKVVRIAFAKADGSKRVMYATRNVDLVKLYNLKYKPKPIVEGEAQETEEQIQNKGLQEYSRDFVRVFDLVEGAWKSYKPSNLLPNDSENGVSSWIEFDTKDDGWYYVSKGSKRASELAPNGKHKAKKVGNDNEARNRFERQRRKEIDELEFYEKRKNTKVVAPTPETNTRKERWNITTIQMKEKFFNANLGIQEFTTINGQKIETKDSIANNQIMEKFFEVANDLKGQLYDLQQIGRGRGGINTVKKMEKFHLVIVSFDNGEVLVLHPNFVINGISHKVHFQKGAEFDFENVVLGEIDEEFKVEIEKYFVSLIKGRGRKTISPLNKVVNTRDDLSRMNKIKAYYETKRQLATSLGIKVTLPNVSVAGSNPLHIFRIETSDRAFLVNVNTFYDVSKDKYYFVRKHKLTPLKDFNDALGNPRIAIELGITDEQYKFIFDMINFGFNGNRKHIN